MHANFCFLFYGKGGTIQISSNGMIVREGYISNLVIYLQYFYIFVFANDCKCKQMNMYIYIYIKKSSDSFFSFLCAEVIFPEKKKMNICKLRQK